MGYRTAWTNSTITSGTINVSIAPAAGEFVIAWAITDANDILSSYSAGWTPLASLRSTADNADLFVLYKIADGSETTVSFTTNSGNSMIAGCAAFSGIDTTTPLDVAPVSFANSASSTTSDISITPVTNGAVLARVQCCDNGSTDATFTFTTTAGTTGAWTTRVDQHASYYDVALGTAEQTTAGAITSRCTTSVSGGRIGWLFALRPAASGGGATVAGQTLTAAGSLVAGAATGAAAVAGQTLTTVASLTAGAVTGAASVSGQTLTAATSLIAGAASTAGSVSVAGQTLTTVASLVAGAVTGAAAVAGQTLTASTSLVVGAATGAASVAGQVLTATGSLIAGAVTGAASVSGQVLTATTSLIAGAVSGGTVTVAGQILTVTATLISGMGGAVAGLWGRLWRGSLWSGGVFRG